ncbi:hypothetical protein K8T06_01015, partial [bacterium]|nr:hypothetical protein [bacterium]
HGISKAVVPVDLSMWIICRNDPVNRLDPDGAADGPISGLNVPSFEVKWSDQWYDLYGIGGQCYFVDGAMKGVTITSSSMSSYNSSSGGGLLGSFVKWLSKGSSKNTSATQEPTIKTRTTRAGDKAIKVTFPDGKTKDISSKRVKEMKPNTHPKAPSGAMQKVKFKNPIPGSKGYKRLPTTDEMKLLEGSHGQTK